MAKKTALSLFVNGSQVHNNRNETRDICGILIVLFTLFGLNYFQLDNWKKIFNLDVTAQTDMKLLTNTNSLKRLAKNKAHLLFLANHESCTILVVGNLMDE